ncbi:Fpg/Nei family DNA glycosylase [Antribacter gilvus]|uniref:Fpg/Nei family DNA glycosylase n=1 Tax=Antribacter gilvus TaxID=2304675 RepID=UPI000F795C5E|nr:DNA-formamidopyrimidine glycosylase family protein [Antribacter gilvus]
MPEGHTVHRLARTFGSLFGDSPLEVTSPQGRFADGAAVLSGRRLEAAEAWGKQLFLGFSGDLWLRTHLGLYGAWTFAGDGSAVVAHAIGAPRKRVGERETIVAPPSGLPEAPRGVDRGGSDSSPGPWVAPEPRGAVRVRLLGEHAVADLTGPAACEVITAAEKAAVEARLGPDPIRAGADPGPFLERVGRSRTTVGQLLMDQAVVAGVGNIYRAEVLFRAGVDPLRAGRDVPRAVVRAIWDDLVDLMADGARTGAIVATRPADRPGDRPGARQTASRPAKDLIGAPGSSLARTQRTRQNTDGTPGAVAAEDAFYVYHRDGLPCRVCGTPVLVKELAGRNLFWCGVCQT